MTYSLSHSAQKELKFEITYLVAKFGRRRALFAILMTYWRGKGRPPDAAYRLNNHLLKDVGLPEATDTTQNSWRLRA